MSGELLVKQIEPRFLPEGSLNANLYDEADVDDVGIEMGEWIFDYYQERKATWPQEIASQVERNYILRCIDQNWTKHIDAMARLREGIFLRSYANVNPLQDYVNEGYKMFRECLDLASVDAVLNLVNVKIERTEPKEEQPTIDVVPEEKKEEQEPEKKDE